MHVPTCRPAVEILHVATHWRVVVGTRGCVLEFERISRLNGMRWLPVTTVRTRRHLIEASHCWVGVEAHPSALAIADPPHLGLADRELDSVRIYGFFGDATACPRASLRKAISGEMSGVWGSDPFARWASV